MSPATHSIPKGIAMFNILSEMQDDFSKINMQKLDSIFELIETERAAALEFARDPDGFIQKQLNGEHLPKETHFHIHIDGTTSPVDQVEITNRLVFSRIIKLPDNLRRELTSLVKEKNASPFEIQTELVTPGRLCRTCRYCSIAIVSWEK
ncbi:hypothetical protein [Pseudomonas sp. GM18]|uniref:hypothetical protein n=1 Tax=Pseudomonas sp. GM18 TaxID=1144324 RepID=UPI000519B812|nr:hypothetical protein [Pseudomonas sp. GM18]